MALTTPLRTRTLREVALEMLDIAREGLHRSAAGDEDETHFLDPLFAIAGSGRTAAEELLEDFRTRWRADIDPVFTYHVYLQAGMSAKPHNRSHENQRRLCSCA